MKNLNVAEASNASVKHEVNERQSERGRQRACRQTGENNNPCLVISIFCLYLRKIFGNLDLTNPLRFRTHCFWKHN